MGKIAAIILAAGQGKRMKSKIQKQYLLLKEKPVLYYSIRAFEQSSVDTIVLVTGKEEMLYCKEEIIKRYNFQKIDYITEGGRERCHSVYKGLQALPKDIEYVLIHDGARPFVTKQMIEGTITAVKEYKACVVGMPVKDTIKITNTDQFSIQTPERQYVWAVQTPQAFSFELVWKAYSMLMEKEILVTDDAMVVETFLHYPVKLIEGSYKNIKITTPEDLIVAHALFTE
ncbi:MAG: 2-C-methyl-D-erythritol 4-phosphate cytidylyltransferase [Lachnospiraceae bacterium]|nr:2-C-methyl-D-erythritol 4-phosphate cytidylyltransferase [Lachnospiraceae bacterium]